MKAVPILPGRASGPVLRLDAPLSFWGGIDAASGCITDPRLPQHGSFIAGTMLMAPDTRGSSSSSAVLLELLRNGRAPAALLLGAVDAILGLGILVAREMEWPTIPLLLLPAAAQSTFESGDRIAVDEDGTLREEEA